MSVVEPEAAEAGAIPVRPVRSPLRSQSRPRPPQGLGMLALNTSSSSSDFSDMLTALPTSATTIDFGKPSASTSTVLPSRASLPNMASTSTASSTSEHTPVPATKAKRVHALLELLSSERAYASDLSLVRELHIPAARGHLPHTGPPPPTPPASSGSSARTASMASNDSSYLEHGPAMTQEDVRQVFGNIAEVALFADTFVDRIEDALGNVLDGGAGPDRVGALFLDIIPMMEPPYAVYISHHTRALSYLESLPRTPALAAYLAHTRASAASFSHAWDLPSLLIKPVQRLLKYPLLLHTIIQDTPSTHPDYECLVQAKARIERVAHAVNEQQRRRQVVASILAEPPQALQIRKRTLLARTHSSKGRPGTGDGDDGLDGDDSESAERLRAMEAELRSALELFDKLADAADAWAASCTAATRSLSVWAHAFGKLLGLDTPPLPADDQESIRSHNGLDEEEPNDAYGAFLALVDKRLAALSHDAASLVAEQLRPNLTKLKTVASQPLTLINALHALQPAHAAVLAHPANKGKPDKQLQENASQYAALRAQLLDELPAALALARAGASACAAAAVRWHTLWFAGARAGWGALWESLRLPEEATAKGREETEAVWRARAADAHASLAGLKSLRPPVAITPVRRDSAASSRSAEEKGLRALVAASMVNALEPAVPGRSPSYADRDREKERDGGRDRERGWRRVGRRRSDDSLKSAASKSSNEDGPMALASSIGYGFGSSFAFASPGATSFASPSGSCRTPDSRRQSVPPAHASIPETDEGTLSRHATDGHRSTPGAPISTTRPSTSRSRTYTGEDRERFGKEKDKDSKDSKRARAAAFLDAVRPAAMVRRSSSKRRDSSPGPFVATEAPLEPASVFPEADVPLDNSYSAREEGYTYIRREDARGKLVPNRPGSEGGVMPPPLRPNRRRDSNGRDNLPQRPSTAGAGSQLQHRDYDYDRERERHSGHEYPYLHGDPHASSSLTQIPHSASQPTLRPAPRESSLSGLPSSASASSATANGLSPPPIPRRAETRGDPSHYGSGGGSRGGSGSSGNGPRPPSPRVSSKWLTQPPRYVVTAVHACTPPAAALYCGLPFFALKRGDAFEVLREAGHPRAHRERGIPLWVEEGGDDCLLLVRKPGRDGAKGELGWALASFMWPVD